MRLALLGAAAPARGGNVGQHHARGWLAAAVLCLSAGASLAANALDRAGPPLAEERLSILPAELADAAAGEDVEALTGQARLHGIALDDRGDVLLGTAPARLAGGGRAQPGAADPLELFVERLSDEERAHLIAGRSLRLDRVSPRAVAVLRSARPDLLRAECPPVWPSDDWFFELALQAVPAGHRDESGDTQARAEVSLRRQMQTNFDLAAAVRFAAVSAAAHAYATLEAPEGPVPTQYVSLFGDLSTQPVAAWDDVALVDHAGGGRAAPPEQREPPVLATVRSTGVHRLAELVALLPGGRWSVDEAWRDETLFVSAAPYEPGFFATALQQASGLLWRASPTEPGQLLLAPHDEPPLAGPAGAASLAALFAAALPAEAPAGLPFSLAALGAGPANPPIPWSDLTAPQRQWLVRQAELALRHGQPTNVLGLPKLTEDDFAGSRVRLRLHLRLSFACYVEGPAPPGALPVFHPIRATSFSLPARRGGD